MNFSFETQRLHARAWSVDDVEDALAMFGDTETMRFIGNGATWKDLADGRQRLADVIKRNSHLRDGLGSWALVDKATHKVMGNIVLKPIPPALADVEVGWHLNRACWGQGYAAEMARVIVEHGLKTVKLDEIIAVIQPGNSRSVAVTRKIGLMPRGQTTKYYEGMTLDLFGITLADLG